MANKTTSTFEKDIANRKLTITRFFDSELALVWLTWTESELLDQWWAPKPWHTETKSFNFSNGGRWLYAMVGPNNERFLNRVDFSNIVFQKSYDAVDMFCDEHGNRDASMPESQWKNEFIAENGGTRVVVTITATSPEAIEKMLEMGFESGFDMALGNLEQYLKAQFKIRTQLRAGAAPRVTSYLNFPGTTEKAFLFYKSVFRSEFSGKGIQRLGDIPADGNMPPIPDGLKKMILHVELPITGGHILMGTDAPKEMGFDLTSGNNMHLNLEPGSREETKRLFDALSEGGTIVDPLKDMFFGSYYGSCKDKFGVNWMVTHTDASHMYNL